MIKTPRLLLRTWKKQDREPYFKLNQDPKLQEFVRVPTNLEQVDAFMENNNRIFAEKKYCLFAVELRDTSELIGFIGLSEPSWQAHFTPCIEIGWRLGSEHWGQGYATEGAKAVLGYAFETLGLAEIVSFTIPSNLRSIAVMEKLGMSTNVKDDFLHPEIPEDHPLSQHVLYRIKNAKNTR